MLTYKFFKALEKNPDYNYSLNKTLQIIVQCKFNKSERVRQSKKLELFYMMHQIIIMHIDIYKAMCARNYDHNDQNDAFQKDDLVSEFFIIFERCVNNYKLELRDKKGKRINFYFYFKKSLMWGIQRLYHLHQKKLQNIDLIGWDNDWKYDVRTVEDTLDFEDFLMDQWGFSQQQKDIIQAKLDGVPIKDFIEENGISSGDYYKQLQTIKDNIKKQAREGNFIHDQFIDSKWNECFGTGGTEWRSIVLAGDKLCDATNQRD